MIRFLPKGASRLINVGIRDRAHAGRLCATVNLWIDASGPEWTVARLKAIREAAYQLRVGNTGLAKEILQANSIGYNHDTLVPKGPFGYVVSGYVSAMKPSVIRKFDALLRLYTCIRLDSLSLRQFLKAKESINGPYEGNVVFLPKLAETVEKFTRKVILPRFSSPVGQDGKVVIDLSKLSPTSATHICKDVLVDGIGPLRELSWGKHITSIWSSVWIPDSLKRINPAEKLRTLLEQSGANSEVAGHIAFLQEGGCKGRVVAVPNAWIQCLMRPLHLSLDRLTTHWTHSCVHDQNQGAYFMTENMRAGETLFCKDLSSATDRFPLALQLAVLRGLNLPQYAEALEEISKGQWLVRTTVNGKSVEESWSYSVGQPMGCYSSFPLFNLTHIIVLMVLQANYGGDFRVLGDDVIVTGKGLADAYTRALTALGVKLSANKCISSDSVGEFAGFTAYRTNHGTTAHRPFKYSGMHGFGAALSLLNSFGKDARRLGGYFSYQLDVFQHTKGWRNPDLSPLISFRDDDEPTHDVMLNSHLLGARSNQLAWYLSYQPVDDLMEVYEEQQIILLGQKEIVTDGFASANMNTAFAPGMETEVKEAPPIGDPHRVQLSSDPLMNQIKGNTGKVEKLDIF